MENEEKLLNCSLKKLESMYQLTVDSRPKTLFKLKNTLENERKVIYVRDCLKHLMKQDFHKISTGNQLLKIFRKDTDLDREIIVYLTEVATKSDRQLFVLPCDSPLHTQVFKNVQIWYENRDKTTVDSTCPVRAIASACMIESTLNFRKVVNALLDIGLLEIENDSITFKFPIKKAFAVLKSALDTFSNQIKNSLGRISNNSYGSFAALIKDANDDIQKETLDEINKYSKTALDARYPRSSRLGNVIKTETVLFDVGNESERCSSVLNRPIFVWPLSLEPEIAFVLLRLFETENKPKTLEEIKYFIELHGNILYVVSPTRALLEIHENIGAKKTMKSTDTEYSLNIYLGSGGKENMADTDTASWLASILNVSSKDKRIKVNKMENLLHDFGQMSTTSDTVKKKLCSFQRFVLNTAKHLAQRTGSLLLFDDIEADRRCQGELEAYMKNNSIDDAEVFSKAIVKLSLEQSTVPVENLVSLLLKDGYLEINEMDETVQYKKGMQFKKSTNDDARIEERFLHGWEIFNTHNVDESGVDMQLASCSRKRRLDSFGNCNAKKQKIVEIISI